MEHRTEAQQRAVVYCVVPEELAGQLHEPLRRHFAEDVRVEVVVEARWRERRKEADRRGGVGEAPQEERRRIHSADGRRVADRRVTAVAVEAPAELPRKARPHVDRLLFLERLEPTDQQLEDRDTARLVTRFQAGDRDVFATLYMRYFDRIYSYFKVALRDDHAAEDATQQVFVKVMRALPRYERRRQPFRAWLFAVVRNHAISELATQRRTEATDPVELVRRNALEEEEQQRPVAPNEILDWISDRELVMFVERLPLPQRQVLMLRFMMGLTNAEIAVVLKRSEVDVRTLQHRALQFLHTRLAAVGRTPESGKPALIRRWVKQAPVLRFRRYALLP